MIGSGRGIAFRGYGSGSGGVPDYIIAYGGFESVSGGYKYHEINANETLNVLSVPDNANNEIEFELIAGGGGGGCTNGGSGGGAGGRIYQSGIALTTGLKPCVIGAGGTGAFGDDNATNGSNSTFLGYTAIGGGRGRSGGYGVVNGGSGGSGGGGSRNGIGGIATSGQGYDGGTSTGQETGGGGGSSQVGGNGAPSLLHGNGGSGTASPIDGVTRAGGGGGGATDGTGTPGTGGAGGGGNGTAALPGVDGTPNTGGGGGGSGTNVSGGDGGSGVLIIKYPFVEPTSYSVDINDIINYTVDNTRYDAASPILLDDGTYLMAFSRYSTNPNDSAPADIVFYTSSNGTTWTYLTYLNSSGGCFIIPSLYQKDNGDIICVYYQTVVGGSKISQQVSTDNGATWGSASTVREVLNEVVALAAGVIYKTVTGRLLLPVYIQTGVNLYDGHVMYSDNEGTSWTMSATTITPADGSCDEAGIYELPDGTLVRFARAKAGANCVWGSNSTDDGTTWGASYEIAGLLAMDSQTFIYKIAANRYVAIYNPSAIGRNLLKTAFSTDGETFYPCIDIKYSATALDQFIEPTPIVVGSDLMVFFADNNRDVAHANYDLKQAIIPLVNFL